MAGVYQAEFDDTALPSFGILTGVFLIAHGFLRCYAPPEMVLLDKTVAGRTFRREILVREKLFRAINMVSGITGMIIGVRYKT